MKSKAILSSILSVGVLTAAAGAQSAPGDFTIVPAVKQAKTSVSTFARVKVVSLLSGRGKEILVLPAVQKSSASFSGRKVTTFASRGFEKGSVSKASSAIQTTAVVLTTDARIGVLAPGQAIMIGSTGGTTTVNLADTLVVRAPGTASARTVSANPLAASVERQVFVGDLARDTTTMSRGLTVGAFAPTTGAIAIGPNGFPVPAAGPQSGTNPIGPNGFPELTTTGPQSGIQPINPNGFPATNVAPFAQTGMTRAGTSRDATAAAATSRAISVGVTALPGVTAGAPATVSVGTTAAPQ